ncbi:MAG: hypothetical protein IK078_02935 [Lachnospiraceae bacterium]|nr:hypothetical protein [Lachnospiraceae bacterium]
MQSDERMQMTQEPDGCYMIAPYPRGDGEEETTSDTQRETFILRMLTENRIQGLICPNVREFNGVKSLYYEVTGKQSLSSYAQNRPLEGEMVRILFETLLGLLQRLPEYCLGPEGLSLDAAQIFTDGKSVAFCYFPYEQNDDGQTTEFSRQLIGMIDQDSEEAVMLAYRFYKLAGEKRGDLRSWLGQLLESGQGGNLSMDQRGQETSVEISEPGENREDKDGQIGKENRDTRDAARTDVISLCLFAGVFLIGLFLFVWKAQALEQFAMELMLSSYEGIAALFFMVCGGLGAGLTFYKS